MKKSEIIKYLDMFDIDYVNDERHDRIIINDGLTFLKADVSGGADSVQVYEVMHSEVVRMSLTSIIGILKRKAV